MFSGKRGGHVEKWLYSDTLRQNRTGSQLWHTFLKTHPDYYVLPNEIELIRGAAKSISQDLQDVDTLVDFGVGDGQALKQKVIPMLDEMPQVENYVGVDLSADFLKAAQVNLTKQRPGINFKGVKRDFYKEIITSLGETWFGLMLGSTISNLEMKEGDPFPRENIVGKLRHFISMPGNSKHFLPSYDANEDVKTIKQAYNSIYWSKFVTGIMYDVDKVAYGDFSSKAWVHEMVWDHAAHVLHHCAVSRIRQDFSIEGQDFKIQAGQRFVTVNTFKYPEHLFTSMASEAGWRVRESYVDEQNRIRLPHLTV